MMRNMPVLGSLRLRVGRWRYARRAAIPNFLRSYAKHQPSATFVEIGANDGKTVDPLRKIILRSEWRGLVVEPLPGPFALLQRNYDSFRDRVTPVNAAVSDIDGTVTVYRLDCRHPGVPEWAHVLSSLNRSHLVAHGDRIPDVESAIRQVTVPSRRFETLCHENGLRRVDVLVTDVEGYDAELISHIDLSQSDTSLVLFEHCHLSSSDYWKLIDDLSVLGFETLSEGYDSMAFRTDLLPELEAAWRSLVPLPPLHGAPAKSRQS